MTILKIMFPDSTSRKQYSYLFDKRSVVVPKPGDTLKGLGYGRGSKYAFCDLKITDVEEVDIVPELVTTAIRVVDKDLTCDVYRLSDTVLKRLRFPTPKKTAVPTIPVAPPKPTKPIAEDTYIGNAPRWKRVHKLVIELLHEMFAKN